MPARPLRASPRRRGRRGRGGGRGAGGADWVLPRLGRGVDEPGGLAHEALQRTLSVIATFARRARALHAGRIRVGATAAVRAASTRDELERRIRELAGSDLEVITGEHEAALSFLGATAGLEAPAPYLVLDIGGGSTEFVLGAGTPAAPIPPRV